MKNVILDFMVPLEAKVSRGAILDRALFAATIGPLRLGQMALLSVNTLKSMPDQPVRTREPDKKMPVTVNLWAMSGEIGLILALPLVVAVLLGIKVDRWVGTMPLFTIVGMVLAFVCSWVVILRRVKNIPQ